MELKKGRKRGREETTQEDYPTFAKIHSRCQVVFLHSFLSALFRPFFSSILKGSSIIISIFTSVQRVVFSETPPPSLKRTSKMYILHARIVHMHMQNYHCYNYTHWTQNEHRLQQITLAHEWLVEVAVLLFRVVIASNSTGNVSNILLRFFRASYSFRVASPT